MSLLRCYKEAQGGFYVREKFKFEGFYNLKFNCSAAPRDGAYIYGIFMEGARWDITQGVITDSKLKELYPALPVINIRVTYNFISIKSKFILKYF